MSQLYLIFLSTIIGIFAAIPGVIWLFFYLRKDAHPESNEMILKIFLLGMLATIPALLIQIGAKQEIEKLNFLPYPLIFLFDLFIVIALTEELSKYLAAKKVLSSSEADEPLDIALYMIIASLGFATSENVFKFVSLPYFLDAPTKIQILSLIELTFYLFITSTFLHGLASGIFGLFMALSFYKNKKKKLLFFAGLFLATFLHGLYNFYITRISEDINAIGSKLMVITIITIMATFLFLGLERLKKIKSICKI